MTRVMPVIIAAFSLVLALVHLTPAQAGSSDISSFSRSSHGSSKYSPWGRDKHCSSQCDAYGSFDDDDCSLVVAGKSSNSNGLIGFSKPLQIDRHGVKSPHVTQLGVHMARDLKRQTSTQGKIQLGLYQQEQRNNKNLNSWKLIAQTEWQSLSKCSKDNYAFYAIDGDCDAVLSSKYNYSLALGIAPKSSINVYANDKSDVFDKYDFKGNKCGNKRNNLPSRYTISSQCNANLDMEMIVCSGSTSSHRK